MCERYMPGLLNILRPFRVMVMGYLGSWSTIMTGLCTLPDHLRSKLLMATESVAQKKLHGETEEHNDKNEDEHLADDPDKPTPETKESTETEGIPPTGDSQSTQLPPEEKKSCCYRFWNAIFKFFAHDSIYGSFVGPHPVSFLCCCIPCKSCCKGSCKRPFVLASTATKMMWFIMLIFTIILSCFFIIPYPQNSKIDPISDFYPCGRDRYVADELDKTCHNHGGYFMVYRNFFALNLLLFVSCLIMINVKSTGRNRYRAKMHHGFWMYKYLILFVLLIISFFGIRVHLGGIFEYLMSWIGLLSSLVFSFAEITFLLDILEPFTVRNGTSKNDWADMGYWSFCGVMIILDIFIIVVLCIFFSTFKIDPDPYYHAYAPYSKGYRASKDGELSGVHISIIVYAIILSTTLIVMACLNEQKKRSPNSAILQCSHKPRHKFPYAGVLQTTFVILYILAMTWSALGNSPYFEARPHINFYTGMHLLQHGSWDIYFKAEGCVQGITSLLALMYYLFWNGPRSTTAPFSILFDKIWYSRAKKPEIPVIPEKMSENDADMFEEGINKMKVWDDERITVRYSWTIFYVFMILGSFAIMMGMCNFADPWAVTLHASSWPALGIKLLITLVITLTYIYITTFPPRSVFPAPDEESPIDKVEEVIEEQVEKVEDAVIATEAKVEELVEINDTGPIKTV